VGARTVGGLLAAGAVTVLLAACGSGGSNDATVTNKAAGATKGVNVVVTNNRTKPRENFSIEICSDEGTCKARRTLGGGETADMSASGVAGTLYFPDGEQMTFTASNPVIGVPYFEFQDGKDSKAVYLNEGDTREVRFACQSFVASRDTDLADYKAMRLSFPDSVECAPGT
jgi:hypothetical protein